MSHVFWRKTWLMTFDESSYVDAALESTSDYPLQKKLEFYLSRSVQAGGHFEICTFFDFSRKRWFLGIGTCYMTHIYFRRSIYCEKIEKKSGKKRNFEIDFSHSITIISKKSDKFLKNPVSFDKYQKPSKNIEKVRKVPKYPKTFWKIPINCAKSPKWLLWLTNLIIWICISITNSVIIY